jgi:hypothetical protein
MPATATLCASGEGFLDRGQIRFAPNHCAVREGPTAPCGLQNSILHPPQDLRDGPGQPSTYLARGQKCFTHGTPAGMSNRATRDMCIVGLRELGVCGNLPRSVGGL